MILVVVDFSLNRDTSFFGRRQGHFALPFLFISFGTHRLQDYLAAADL